MFDLWLLLVVMLAAVLGAAIYLFQLLAPAKPNPPLPDKVLTLGGAQFIVELANTYLARAAGLSGRTSLGPDRGMLFDFARPGRQSFWMKDMHFPVDIVWIRDNRVVGFVTAPAPAPKTSVFKLPAYYSPEPVNFVLELPAGTMAKNGLKVGDEIKFL